MCVLRVRCFHGDSMYFYASFEAIPFDTRGRGLYLHVCSMYVSRTYFNRLLLSETFTDRMDSITTT